jgi:hypothetical protein
MGTLHEDVSTFMTVSRWILLRMRKFSDKSGKENQNTFLCSTAFSHLWDNVKKYGGAREPTHGNIVYVILLLFYGKNVFVNVPLCYIIRALPLISNNFALFYYTWSTV